MESPRQDHLGGNHCDHVLVRHTTRQDIVDHGCITGLASLLVFPLDARVHRPASDHTSTLYTSTAHRSSHLPLSTMPRRRKTGLWRLAGPHLENRQIQDPASLATATTLSLTYSLSAPLTHSNQLSSRSLSVWLCFQSPPVAKLSLRCCRCSPAPNESHMITTGDRFIGFASLLFQRRSAFSI